MPKIQRKLRKNKVIKDLQLKNPRRVELGKFCGYIKDNFVKNTFYQAFRANSGNVVVWHDGYDVYTNVTSPRHKLLLMEDIDLAFKIVEEVINNEYSK